MKCCVKFQTAINSSRKMKHGNFRASRAADMYFNLKKKTGTLSLYLKYNFLTAGFYYSRFSLT